MSVWSKAAACSGVEVRGSTLSARNCCCTAGVATVANTARCSRSTTGRGVRAGTASAFHDAATKPFTPSSTAVGAALWWITPFTPLQAGLIALVANIMGFFGGFVLSAIKRDRGVKDWGAMIEGHGGMLDRVDSLSFSAPIFFHIVRYWWA